MLELTKGQSSESIILTLTELTTLSPVFYLLVFTHVTTRAVVSFVAPTDESEYPERYNLFPINTQARFSAHEPGEWHYVAYEQSSPTNTDVTMTGAIVETGKLMLRPASEFEYDKYNEATTYKTYNG